MKHYFKINQEKQVITFLNSTHLYFEFLHQNKIAMEDLTSVRYFDEFIERQRENCFPIFYLGEFKNPILKSIQVTYKGVNYSLNNMDEAILFCRNYGLSDAKDGVIRRTILNALTGKTKGAYGRPWQLLSTEVNTENYTIEMR